MTVALVPRRPDGGRRDQIWYHMRTTYWPRLACDVVEGEHHGGAFNRAAALNAAAAAADPWDVAIVADADVYVRPDVVEQAVATARERMSVVIAFQSWRNLDEASTLQVLAGAEPSHLMPATQVRHAPTALSGMVVVPRPVWDTVGGFDEGFVDYGYEDMAFVRACELVAPIERSSGPALHLNHPRGQAATQAGRDRYGLYQRARTIDDAWAIRG